MTLFDFALKNVTRDKQSYIYYFVNCLFSVMVFFLFSVLSFHPATAIIGEGSTMALILMIGELFIVAFAFISITYSVLSFMRVKSKQYGVLTITGASRRQLGNLIFWENMLVGEFAIISGILLGLLCSKLFLDIAGNVLGNVDFYFYFPVKAILLTAGVMTLTFLLIASAAPRLIRKEKIITLVKAENKVEKPQRLLPLVIILLVCLAATTYVQISNTDLARYLVDSQIAIIPEGIAFVLAIYLLISFGGRLLSRAAKRSGSYYRGVKMISMSTAADSRRSNSVAMTLIAVLFSVCFFSLAVLMSQTSNIEEQTEQILPAAVQYADWRDEADSAARRRLASEIRNRLDHLDGYQELRVQLKFPSGQDTRAAALSLSDYNSLMSFYGRERIRLAPGEVYLVAGDAGREYPDSIPPEILALMQPYMSEPTVVGGTNENVFLTGMVSTITVMKDRELAAMAKELSDFDIYLFDYSDKFSPIEEMDEIRALENDSEELGWQYVIFAYRYYRSDQIQTDLTLYIGSLLFVAFIVAAISFVFSRLYSSFSKDCARLRGLVKVGLSKKEVSRILLRPVTDLITVPYLLAFLIMWAGVLLVNKLMIVSLVPFTATLSVILVLALAVLTFSVYSAYKNKMFTRIYN